jgi:GxxExxY protein
MPSHAALLPIFRLSKARGVRIPAAVCNRRATPGRRKSGATRRARAPWAVWLRCSLLTGHCGHARRSRLAIHPKPLSRGAAGYFNRLLVNDCLLVELKAVEVLHPSSKAQLFSYMKLPDVPIGLLINFHELILKNGIFRMILPGANKAEGTGTSDVSL